MSDLTPFPGFRPGPRSGEEKQHHAAGFRWIPEWCSSQGPRPRELWERLLTGEVPRLAPGWGTVPVLEASDLEALQVAPRHILVSFVPSPEERLIWKFPEPDFTTGVLWACWRDNQGPGFSYNVLEAGASPGRWVFGHEASGPRSYFDPLATGRLEDFLALIDQTVNPSEEEPFAGSGEPMSQIDLVLETLRARMEGDEERLRRVLATRFAEGKEIQRP